MYLILETLRSSVRGTALRGSPSFRFVRWLWCDYYEVANAGCTRCLSLYSRYGEAKIPGSPHQHVLVVGETLWGRLGTLGKPWHYSMWTLRRWNKIWWTFHRPQGSGCVSQLSTTSPCKHSTLSVLHICSPFGATLGKSNFVPDL